MKLINLYKYSIYFLFIIFCLLFISCSSLKKDPGDIFDIRIQTEDALESGNKQAAIGNFDLAQKLLEETKRYAILTDDSSLIVRVCLSLGNVLYSLGRKNEAFSEWELAVAEAQRFKNAELLAVSIVYLARGNLIDGRVGPREVLEIVTRESSKIKSNKLYIAFSWQVRGLAHRSLREFTQAESAFKRSLDIHLKDRYLENASYDWYIIGTIRSLSGKYEEAIQAIQSSLTIDRRIENSWGIASSYRAMGEIYRKMGRHEEALVEFRRAKRMYDAMGNTFESAEIDKLIRN